MTGREADTTVAPAPSAEPSPIDQPLPSATVGGMAGLLEILVARGGREDLPTLARDLMFEVDDLLPLVDGASLLGFATVEDADLCVTDDGRDFVLADILTTKQLFARKAAARAPLVKAINNALAASIDGNLPEQFFVDILRRGFSEDEARHQLDIAIDWGRYGGALRLRRQHPSDHPRVQPPARVAGVPVNGLRYRRTLRRCGGRSRRASGVRTSHARCASGARAPPSCTSTATASRRWSALRPAGVRLSE